MSYVDPFRLKLLKHLSRVGSIRDSWEVFQPAIKTHLMLDDVDPATAASNIFNLGSNLSNIFRSNAVGGRGQDSVSGGGAAWECLVSWYLNLILWDTNVIATRQNRAFVPSIINDSLCVTIANNQTNTESDVVVYNVIPPDGNEECNLDVINDAIHRKMRDTTLIVLQCKTNWNDNAQIPMLWDLIYNSSQFRIQNVSVGRHGVSPASFGNFGYGFVTVPTSRGPFKANGTCVLRVHNMTAGNFWGKPSESGIASSLTEFFTRHYTNQFEAGVRNHVLNNLVNNREVINRFVNLDF